MRVRWFGVPFQITIFMIGYPEIGHPFNFLIVLVNNLKQ